MKRKLLLLFIPIALSIFGTIYFQIDWAFKTYQTGYEKISAAGAEALRLAIDDHHHQNQHDLTQKLLQQLTPLVDSIDLIFSNDSLIINLDYRHDPPIVRGEDQTGRLTHNNDKIRINFPQHRFGDGRRQMAEVELKFVDRSDTLQQRIREVVPYFRNSCTPLYFEADSVRIADYFKAQLVNMGLGDLTSRIQLVFFCGEQVPLDHPPLLGRTLIKYRTQGLEGYSYNSRWIGAYFHNYQDKILWQMLGPLCLSAFLIVIMILCFSYLIRIILKQKHIAEMKDNYINNMTHELQTPIATISAAVEGMQNFKVLEDRDKTQQYLSITRSELLRLSNMVTKILNLSIYDRNEIEMIIQQVNLADLMTGIVAAEKLKATKDVTIILNIADDLPLVQIDPLHFRNVLTNVIENAVKYSGEAVTITVECYRDDTTVYIRISDNGIGIPSSQLRYIFDKFYRVSTGNIHNVKGSGLGLYYVRYIVERHGGSISVKSEITRGTEFVISIPLRS